MGPSISAGSTASIASRTTDDVGMGEAPVAVVEMKISAIATSTAPRTPMSIVIGLEPPGPPGKAPEEPPDPLIAKDF